MDLSSLIRGNVAFKRNVLSLYRLAVMHANRIKS